MGKTCFCGIYYDFVAVGNNFCVAFGCKYAISWTKWIGRYLLHAKMASNYLQKTPKLPLFKEFDNKKII